MTGSAAFDAPAIEFELQTSAATSIDIFGPQAEAQWVPSNYKKSSTVGVYQNARFLDDVFTYTSTDVNRTFARL